MSKLEVLIRRLFQPAPFIPTGTSPIIRFINFCGTFLFLVRPYKDGLS